ncbi:hypothetical protein DFH28DRAFT_1078541 [Melampsora americana]|nr:hypothetical protein DFH28DRAFT_1078541 [Melampsora americana]
MRLLDLPPHQSQFQSITSKDEINLYNWIDQAFVQLLYLKKLWIPTKDWSETDDRIEEDQRDQNWLILKESFQHQILNPLGFKYGHHLVESNLNQLIQTICPEKGEEIIEWMSEKTSDVIWPGLVRLRADQTIARKYWESESRRFSTRFGGVPRGLGKDGEMLEIDEEMGEPCEWVDGPDSDSDHRVEEVMKTAEGILIKEFIEERQLRSKS